MKWIFEALVFFVSGVLISNRALAGDVSLQAKVLYERLTGTKVGSTNSSKLDRMSQLLNQGKDLEAAAIATDDPNFYNVTVKSMALQMSTREETSMLKLNDFAASFIGVTRDQLDARLLLSGNFYYRGATSLAGVRATNNDLFLTNNHYDDLDDNKIDLSANLIKVDGQVIMTDAATAVQNPDPAGILTSRAFIRSHAASGTNRRLMEYSFREFLCVPLAEAADNLASDSHIGRDVDRFPGGDHNKFEQSCKSCHTIMDGFRGAFAKVDFKGAGIIHSAVNAKTGKGAAFISESDVNGVMNKYSKNSTVYPPGYITTDDSFVNNAIRPARMDLFGWRGNYTSGKGISRLGMVLGNSKRFSQCMAKRVFETVCNKNLNPSRYKSLLESWGHQFEGMNYNLKKLFQMISVQKQCL